MRRLITSFLAILVELEIQLPQTSMAAFLNSGATARSTALGNTDVVIADDAAALLSNPAGVASVRRPEAVADYDHPYTGLSDGSEISQYYLGGAMPLPIGGTLAAGWKQLHFDGLYSERTLSVGYGRWWTPRLALGIGVKQLQLAYSPPNQIVDDYGNVQAGTPDLFAHNGTERSVYSTDMGALFKCTPHTTLGLAVLDVNQPNLALSDEDRDPLARTIRAGVASEMKHSFTLAMAVQTRRSLANERDWIWTGGVERQWAESASGRFAARASLSAGSRDDHQLAAGASYGVGAVDFDYAFSMALSGVTLGETTGGHRFSMRYRFGAGAETAPHLVALKTLEKGDVSPDMLTDVETTRHFL